MLRTGAVVLLVFIAVTPALIFPQDADGVFPLVIFSHGGLGIRRSNATLYEELASHGYVVGSIGHPYHAFWTQDVQGRLTFLSRDYFGELTREDAQRDKQQSYTYYRRWMDTRMGDINFVIDTVRTSTTARSWPTSSASMAMSSCLSTRRIRCPF